MTILQLFKLILPPSNVYPTSSSTCYDFVILSFSHRLTLLFIRLWQTFSILRVGPALIFLWNAILFFFLAGWVLFLLMLNLFRYSDHFSLRLNLLFIFLLFVGDDVFNVSEISFNFLFFRFYP